MHKRTTQKLKNRMRTLKRRMAALGPLMRGSVVELKATCGNPNCRCARGQKHKKYYYSMSRKGKTKVIYLGKSREPVARQYSENYRALLEIVEEMTMINIELLKAGAVRKSR